MSPNKVIISCAVTGAIHTPSMSPYLPADPDAIRDAAIGAAEAGAAILHVHARHPTDGRPKQDPDLFRSFLPAISETTDAVINITTGGSPHMTVQERIKPAATLSPELASLNMGSMNFGLFPMPDEAVRKKERKRAYTDRAKRDMAEWLGNTKVAEPA